MLGIVKLNPATLKVRCSHCGEEFEIEAKAWDDNDGNGTPVKSDNDSDDMVFEHYLVAYGSCPNPECEQDIFASVYCQESDREGIVYQGTLAIDGATLISEQPLAYADRPY